MEMTCVLFGSAELGNSSIIVDLRIVESIHLLFHLVPIFAYVEDRLLDRSRSRHEFDSALLKRLGFR